MKVSYKSIWWSKNITTIEADNDTQNPYFAMANDGCFNLAKGNNNNIESSQCNIIDINMSKTKEIHHRKLPKLSD